MSVFTQLVLHAKTHGVPGPAAVYRHAKDVPVVDICGDLQGAHFNAQFVRT
jgi:hypothetical protein